MALRAAADRVHDARPVRVHVDDAQLHGDLVHPQPAIGLVLFAHGSGSSRHSPRNSHVAHVLNDAGLATLLIDLLTAAEERTDAIDAHLRFDIPLLASRLVGVEEAVAGDALTPGLRLGLFGASTGAAAALVAAARRPEQVHAVVSRGGRPDLAGASLADVRAPTLLIVGSRDVPVIALNREAMTRLRSPQRLEIVPGATHLFEEPGALDAVARLARDWFVAHLAGPAAA